MSDVFTSTYNLVKKVCLDRRAVRKFLNKDIPDGVLEDILVTTQSAPSSQNTQPYKILIIRNKEDKAKLANDVMGGNINVVNSSSATILFLADTKPYKTADEYAQLQRATGHSEKGIQSHLNALKWQCITTPVLGPMFNWLYNGVGLFKKVVRRPTGITYSSAQTFLALQQFVLLCQAQGLGNVVLGGYDNNRIQKDFNIPSRYNVAAAVCVGYEDKTEKYKPSLRYKPETMIFESVFGKPCTTKLNPIPGKQTWEEKKKE